MALKGAGASEYAPLVPLRRFTLVRRRGQQGRAISDADTTPILYKWAVKRALHAPRQERPNTGGPAAAQGYQVPLLK